MTPGQWEQITGEVEALWGRSSKWVLADAAFRHVRDVAFDAAERAVQSMFGEGRPHAPSMDELVKRARSFAPAVQVSPESCSHPRFGIVAEDEATGMRTVVCASCRLEERRLRVNALTDSERDPAA